MTDTLEQRAERFMRSVEANWSPEIIAALDIEGYSLVRDLLAVNASLRDETARLTEQVIALCNGNARYGGDAAREALSTLRAELEKKINEMKAQAGDVFCQQFGCHTLIEWADTLTRLAQTATAPRPQESQP